ncbi:SprT family zinc-dependent metalloprotease [Sulfitobacter sp. PR48]|jgi:predicted metal-dependent hydrolase|uniref:M48 family metallopeptidase n=1 Tax=unclassified Sulfitobacter TaxID=196795 RepID=UPI0022AE6B08|nr:MULTISPECIES: SprT family zinc-dependent metalloprotease [unclassified Sulfitobacter]MCZ4257448.1 SprT family zinc-dependent metalloprotease [Sulfitobacter sp. G21635-S1]MDD9719954.1 SprT family zinc-dependent metalloprotease [Sulfitobacter sp. PR48]
MSDPVLSGDPPIPLILRRSARAKRISLRISQLDGRVTLTLPKRLAEREALDFARSKEGWIRKHLDARGADLQVLPGVEVPVAGQMLKVARGQGRRVQIGADVIAVPGPEERVGVRLASHLKLVARDRLAAASDAYAAQLGLGYSRLTLRDTRSRWGSCTSDGALMFSWRLIMTPPEVLNYVAAHEVAHLAQMNHSPAFWAEVTRLYGDYDPPRRWLRTHGSGLHRYRF